MYMLLNGCNTKTDLVGQSNELHIEVLLHSRALKTLRLREALPDPKYVGSESGLEVGERSSPDVITYHEKKERTLRGAKRETVGPTLRFGLAWQPLGTERNALFTFPLAK